MKKTILCIAVVFLGCIAANAQVKFGFGLGYALPLGDTSDFLDGGLAFHGELGYGVTDNIDVSLMYQGDVLVGADFEGESFGNLTLSTIMVNGRYFFREEGFRPYGALGLGVTSIGAIETEGNGVTTVGTSESNFAIRPALGFKYKVLNVNAAYLNAGKVGESSIADLTFNIGLLFTFGGNK